MDYVPRCLVAILAIFSQKGETMRFSTHGWTIEQIPNNWVVFNDKGDVRVEVADFEVAMAFFVAAIL